MPKMIKKILYKTAILFFLMNGYAFSSEFVFSCKTNSGKEVKVEKSGDVAIYSFGKDINNPEMKIKNKLKELDIILSEPMGSEIVTNIPFKNGDYTYSVFMNTDRLNDEHKSTSGVSIFKNEKYITIIECLTQKGNLLDIDSAE
ncbi:hypothetical protein HB991_06475 [Yersinia mollaretii]|uniref:Uncharacterized protein n=1 Tax=Yersinia mollaretii TaxID=33060 RepID=A0AA44CK95_YERMO|nr:hypothetical protein [Yersinia mollaretii]NIL22160.1 hypothetical protein [Yersinia mollaretii]CNJ13001.1 Uncharacterised protein [Yersinia mollaretii]CQR07633.1 Uncharacterised protein [Yersinia mollaretii]